MYENQVMGQKECAVGLIDDRGSKTVGENIDIKIAQLQNEIKRLEESKASLAPLLGMKIRDVREAMSY
mgnify:FL=1